MNALAMLGAMALSLFLGVLLYVHDAIGNAGMTRLGGEGDALSHPDGGDSGAERPTPSPSAFMSGRYKPRQGWSYCWRGRWFTQEDTGWPPGVESLMAEITADIDGGSA